MTGLERTATTRTLPAGRPVASSTRPLFGAVALSVHEAFQTGHIAGRTTGDLTSTGFGAARFGAGMVGAAATGTVAGVSAVTAAAQLASEVSRSEGGGMRGAFQGARAGAEALSAEAIRAAVPRLGGESGTERQPNGSAAQHIRERTAAVRGERLGREAHDAQDFAENVGEVGSTAQKPPQGNSPLKIAEAEKRTP